MSRSRTTAILSLVALAVALGCAPAGDFTIGTFSGPGTDDTAAAAVAVVSGDNQTGTFGTALPDPLVVRVTNSTGDSLNGVPVDWSVTAGGGAVSRTSTTTDAQGQAQVTLTLGPGGINTVQATVRNTSLTASFTATATSGTDNTAASILLVSGDNQSAALNTALPDSLVVRVRNAAAQNLSGVTVQWTVTEGGGTLGSATSSTDAQGQASNTLTVGSGTGPQTVTAAVQSNTSLAVTFNATATAVGAAAGVTVDNDFFTPANVPVLSGGVVTWTWAPGAVTHNVTWVSGGFANSGDQSSGTHQVNFPAAGTFNYYCSIHGTPTTGMRGTVTVSN